MGIVIILTSESLLWGLDEISHIKQPGLALGLLLLELMPPRKAAYICTHILTTTTEDTGIPAGLSVDIELESLMQQPVLFRLQ